MDVIDTRVLSETTTSSETLATISMQNAIFMLVKFLDTRSVPLTPGRRAGGRGE